MNKFFILILIFPVLLTGAQEYIKMSDNISDPFIKDYQRRTGLQMIGFGGGMMNDVDKVCMTFVGSQRLDIPAVRRLYISGVEDLLNRYNCNKKIRPYLHNFPFVISNIDFDIYFEDSPGTFVPRNFVTAIFYSKGTLCYSYRNHELGKLMKLYEEPYEEAVRIVHAECEQANNNASVSLNSLDLLPQRKIAANRRVSE